jgi:hypothetical protein
MTVTRIQREFVTELTKKVLAWYQEDPTDERLQLMTHVLISLGNFGKGGGADNQ